MTETNTFSAAVDDAIQRTGRPDRKADIIGYVRASIRECQMKRFFWRDYVEDQLTATNTSPQTAFIWTYPAELRQLHSVRYEILDPRGNFIYPKWKPPGKLQEREYYFYYRGVDYYAFKGVQENNLIDVGYFSYLPMLAYYATADRPASFSLETQTWSYLSATTSAEQLAAQALVTNWLLTNWYDLIVEGAVAKAFKTASDPRAVSSFALFKSYQNDLIAGEGSETFTV